MQKVVALFCAILFVQAPSGVERWRGITPLGSTRTDVERLLGKPNFEGYLYKFEKERVHVLYSTKPCSGGVQGGWRVPLDTVIAIKVTPKSDKQFATLKTDETKFKMSHDPHTSVRYYTNDEQGVSYEVYENGIISSVSYGPTSKDAHLKCPASR